MEKTTRKTADTDVNPVGADMLISVLNKRHEHIFPIQVNQENRNTNKRAE